MGEGTAYETDPEMFRKYREEYEVLRGTDGYIGVIILKNTILKPESRRPEPFYLRSLGLAFASTDLSEMISLSM